MNKKPVKRSLIDNKKNNNEMIALLVDKNSNAVTYYRCLGLPDKKKRKMLEDQEVQQIINQISKAELNMFWDSIMEDDSVIGIKASATN